MHRLLPTLPLEGREARWDLALLSPPIEQGGGVEEALKLKPYPLSSARNAYRAIAPGPSSSE